ncbi:MAG: response regulator, partial [Abditibacteriales bacterium]|nr:response regulator [Abditibacteriales bacterium]
MPQKILIVEDEKLLVESLTFNLRKAGYEVVVAYDGAEALTKARREYPDLIILDLMLPHVAGIDVCRILRRE